MKWLLCLLPLTSGCVAEELIDLSLNIRAAQALVGDVAGWVQAYLETGGV